MSVFRVVLLLTTDDELEDFSVWCEVEACLDASDHLSRVDVESVTDVKGKVSQDDA